MEKKKRRAWVVMLPLWLMIVLLFVGYVSTQTVRYRDSRAELDQLQTQLEDEKQNGENLRQQELFFGSDLHFEQLAREKGLVRPGEIIFENVAE